MGDYLETQGWYMIDGDRLSYSKDPKDQAAWRDILTAYKAWIDGGNPPENLWKKHFETLVKEAIVESKKGKDVVITFVAYKKNIREMVRKAIPGIMFIQLEVE